MTSPEKPATAESEGQASRGERLRELSAAGTPGPWVAERNSLRVGDYKPLTDASKEGQPRGYLARMLIEDAALIAEARNALDDLLGGVSETSSETALAEAKSCLEQIRELADWYSRIHGGPQIEVDHALKVEVLDLAERGLETISKAGGAGA